MWTVAGGPVHADNGLGGGIVCVCERERGRERQRETERDRQRDTERERDRVTERKQQRETHTDRDRERATVACTCRQWLEGLYMRTVAGGPVHADSGWRACTYLQCWRGCP